MPLVKQQRKISPLDLNKNVTIGVAFPLNDTNMFRGTETVNEQNKSNLLNLLLTQQGERVNHPNFGVALQNYLFEQNINPDNVEEEINQQINIYIPEIFLVSTDIDFIPDEHTLNIKITYQFKLDNTQDAITITI